MDFFIFTLYQIKSFSSEFNLLETLERALFAPICWRQIIKGQKYDAENMWEYKHTLFADPPLAELFVSLDGRTKQSEKNCANLRRSKLS